MESIWKRLFSRRRALAPHGGRSPGAVPADYPAPSTAAVAPIAASNLNGAQIRDHFHRLLLGMPPSPEQQPRLTELATLKRLDQLCGEERFDIASLPRLPTVLPQLLGLLRSDDSDGTKLAKLIGRDPVLVGEVMRIAQSPHYRTVTPITSLQHAVVLLGHDGLRRIVTLHVMRPILQASVGMYGHAAGQRLWDHAERCAHASQFLARGEVDAFEAYLAGVICNAGVGAVIRVLDQEAPPNLGVFSQGFIAGCAWMASHLSWRAAQHWELPAVVVEALRERVGHSQQPPHTALGRALLAADQLAMAHILAEHRIAERDMPLPAQEHPHLPGDQLQRAQQDLRRHFRNAEPYPV